MNRREVIAWLRREAQKLTEAADSLEEADRQVSVAPSAGNGAVPQLVTVEMVKARLRRGSSRVPQLAKEFRTDQETLRRMVRNKANGIVMEERGWLKLRENVNG
jgi:hypothetical protein